MKLRIFEEARSFETDLVARVELGRQKDQNEAGPYALRQEGDGTIRVVIGWNAEVDALSRRHLQLEPLPDQRVRLTNLSPQFKVALLGGEGTLDPGQSTELRPPFSLGLGGRTITVGDAPADDRGLHRLNEQTLAPGGWATLTPGSPDLPRLSGPQFDQLVAWLQTTMSVLHGAVGSAAFLPRAAKALVDIVGLHSGRVLLRRGGGWDVEVVHGGAGTERAPWQPSATVLDVLLREKRTVWQRTQPQDAAAPSLAGLQTVVAAPLLDAGGDVIGALYGELRRDRPGEEREAHKLQAVLVELLAGGVAAGLARQRQEQEATRNQTLFEQFFTPPLAARLRQFPDLLRGRTETVTVLFADVRAFSAFSGRLGPEVTERWLGDVLGELSRCVLAEGGVLVDYIGDELLAMWGAPTPQPDQTEHAARAGLGMLRALAVLNERWGPTLHEDMGLGIGINRGPAQVGNIGSVHKFKYGPLGHTVNVASRVQGLTKYLKCGLVVTAETRAHLGSAFTARRLGRARMVNIAEPVELHEVAAAAEGRSEFFRAAEQALEALEGGAFAAASRQAGALLERHPGDGPLLLVLSRAADALVRNDREFDPVWTPPGK